MARPRKGQVTKEFLRAFPPLNWELRNIYHHPESKKRKSSEANSGFIQPYGRSENAVKTRKAISTIAILWPVKAIFEKRAATAQNTAKQGKTELLRRRQTS